MGEKIKDIKEIKIGQTNLMIELNKPVVTGGERDIHIQNNKFRASFSESEFLQMACCIISASKKIRVKKEKIKNGK